MVEFRFLMKEALGGFAGEDIFERLFAVMDLNKDSCVSFLEWTTGLSLLLRGSKQQKLALMFAVYDEDGNGSLSLDEVQKFVHRSLDGTTRKGRKSGGDKRAEEDKQAFAAEVMRTIDANSDGAVTREEFATALIREPALFEAFSRSIAPALASNAPINFAYAAQTAQRRMEDESKQRDEVVRRVVERTSRLDLGLLFRVWRRYGGSIGDKKKGEIPDAARGGASLQPKDAGDDDVPDDLDLRHAARTGELTFPAFQKLMVAEFGVTQAVFPLLRRVYHHFDAAVGDGNGSLSVHELFQGLSQVLTGSLEQRASFFFDLYDANSSGILDLTEIGALLSLTRSGADDILRIGREQPGDGSDGGNSSDEEGGLGGANKHHASTSAFGQGRRVVSDEARERRRRWRERQRTMRLERQRNRRAIVEPLAALARAGLPSTPEELLDQLDANGDGQVQKSEFIAACRSNPRLLIILGLAFGGRAVSEVIDEEMEKAGFGSVNGSLAPSTGRGPRSGPSIASPQVDLTEAAGGDANDDSSDAGATASPEPSPVSLSGLKPFAARGGPARLTGRHPALSRSRVPGPIARRSDSKASLLSDISSPMRSSKASLTTSVGGRPRAGTVDTATSAGSTDSAGSADGSRGGQHSKPPDSETEAAAMQARALLRAPSDLQESDTRHLRNASSKATLDSIADQAAASPGDTASGKGLAKTQARSPDLASNLATEMGATANGSLFAPG